VQRETERDSTEEAATFHQLPLNTILSSEIHNCVDLGYSRRHKIVQESPRASKDITCFRRSIHYKKEEKRKN